MTEAISRMCARSPYLDDNSRSMRAGHFGVDAVRLHTANHPDALRMTELVNRVDLIGPSAALVLFVSPPCVHFSRPGLGKSAGGDPCGRARANGGEQA